MPSAPIGRTEFIWWQLGNIYHCLRRFSDDERGRCELERELESGLDGAGRWRTVISLWKVGDLADRGLEVGGARGVD